MKKEKYKGKRVRISQAVRVRSAAPGILLRTLLLLLITAVLLTNLFTHVVMLVRYTGEGMEPGLHSGQTLLINKLDEPEAGDVIAFYFNNRVLVRRIIAVGGDRISVAADGAVQVNDILLSEPYVSNPSMGQCDRQFPYYVQIGHVFVMGDNRAVSMDSRLAEIGVISRERIIGTVILAV